MTRWGADVSTTHFWDVSTTTLGPLCRGYLPVQHCLVGSSHAVGWRRGLLVSGVVFISMALVPRHLEQQSTRRHRLLVSGEICVSALVPGRLVQRSIHPCFSAVQSSTGWPLQGNKPVEGWQGTSRTMWSGSGAVSDDDVHMSVIVPCGISFETYFWHVFRAWPKNFTVCQGPFESCSPSTAVRRLLQQLTPTSVQDLRSF